MNTMKKIWYVAKVDGKEIAHGTANELAEKLHCGRNTVMKYAETGEKLRKQYEFKKIVCDEEKKIRNNSAIVLWYMKHADEWNKVRNMILNNGR